MRTMVMYLFNRQIFFNHSFEVHIYSLCLTVPSIPNLCNVGNILLEIKNYSSNFLLFTVKSTSPFQPLGYILL